MSFAALGTWQAWLVIAAVVAAAVWLFLLKIRPPQIVVPSLALWSRVLNESRERTLWERIRRAVSLIVAVLITLAILLAVLRPQAAVPSIGGDARRNAATQSGRISIVIDSSWSMLAQTASGQTRWDRAVSRARALAIGAGGEEVVLATTADGVVEGPTPDVALIEAALDRIAPSGGETTAWPRVDGARATYFLTDGAIARPLDSDVTVESMFEAAANVAITAFDVRSSTAQDSAGQAFLEVANYADTTQSVHISVSRGEQPILDVTTDLAAGAAVQRVVPLERRGDARLRARISAKSNALVVDDEAVAWIEGMQPLRVVVISPQPSSFGPLLNQDPAIRTTVVAPSAYKPGTEDVVIVDRVHPEVQPTAPTLYIAPPEAPTVTTKGSTAPEAHATTDAPVVKEENPQWVIGPWHPLLQGVDVRTMVIERARSYAGAGLEPIAFSMTNTPLIYVHDAAEQRFVLLTFSVVDSKLMFAPGFPVFMGNAIEWLAHPVPSRTQRPGPATFAARVTSIQGPDGKPVPVTSIDSASRASLLRPGLYQIKSGGATSVLAVNVGDPDTSDLRRTRLSAESRAVSGATSSRGRPWWLIAATLALALLAAEWWTWQRRITV